VRIIIVVGSRPNFVKVAPLLPALVEAGHAVDLAFTGSKAEYRLDGDFHSDLSLEPPRFMLDLDEGPHGLRTAQALTSLERLFTDERPAAVIAVGDVDAALAAALGGVKLAIPIVHLEAGLRSGDLSMPEEVNRVVVDQLASMHLAPTEEAVENLHAEGVASERVHFVGNIVAEGVLRHLERPDGVRSSERLGLHRGGYVLVSVRREELVGRPELLAEVAAGLGRGELPVLVLADAWRLQPWTNAAVKTGAGNVRVVDSVFYGEMLGLERDAAAVVTDSGHVQEEACVIGTPCVTLRRTTEHGVTLTVGANRLCAADSAAVRDAVATAIASRRSWPMPPRWDKLVSDRVVRALRKGVLPLAGE